MKLPSPALAISVLALVIAVGGGAYAVGASTNKTIRTIVNKQISKRAPKLSVRHAVSADNVTSAKTATSADTAKIADSAKTAGSASTAATATTAQSLAPPEAVHLIGAAGEPKFENGTENGNVLTNNPAGFYKDRQCVVHLQGTIYAKPGGGARSFTLPPAYRPPNWVLGAVGAYNGNPVAAYYEVSSENGYFTVYADSGAAGVPYGLDGINFRAATC